MRGAGKVWKDEHEHAKIGCVGSMILAENFEGRSENIVWMGSPRLLVTSSRSRHTKAKYCELCGHHGRDKIYKCAASDSFSSANCVHFALLYTLSTHWVYHFLVSRLIPVCFRKGWNAWNLWAIANNQRPVTNLLRRSPTTSFAFPKYTSSNSR